MEHIITDEPGDKDTEEAILARQATDDDFNEQIEDLLIY